MPCPRCGGPEVSDKVLRLLASLASCLKREKELPKQVDEALKSMSDDEPWHFCARCLSARTSLDDCGIAEFQGSSSVTDAFNAVLREQRRRAWWIRVRGYSVSRRGYE